MCIWTWFVKIWMVSREFAVNFLTCRGLRHLLFELQTIGVVGIVIWWLILEKKPKVIMAGNLNSGLSYLIKTVIGGKGVLLWCFFQFVSMNEGHLTNKDHLPVTKINFSGLGQHFEQPRKVKFQLGPLFCVQ